MTKTLVNIACGAVYVEGWQNFDYTPHSSVVRRADLLGRLPLVDGRADVVYSSHFIEHVPTDRVQAFLAECFRITKPGGHLRLVTPDLEELCRTYLEERARQAHEKADFVVLEMLDQCVRTTNGGKLGAFYASMEADPDRHSEMIRYVESRSGHVLGGAAPPAKNRLVRLLDNPARLVGKLEEMYCRALVSLLPAAFRNQNVSFTSVGERHTWIYDFYTLERMLTRIGFTAVQRLTADTTKIDAFPLFPLDIKEDGTPRKGSESMYIEATKS